MDETTPRSLDGFLERSTIAIGEAPPSSFDESCDRWSSAITSSTIDEAPTSPNEIAGFDETAPTQTTWDQGCAGTRG